MSKNDRPDISWVGGDKPYKLNNDYTFTTEYGTWTVPGGYCYDGASVPRIPFVYARYGNTAQEAACLHDWHYEFQETDRRTADKAFLEVMEQFDNPSSRSARRMMYRAVRWAGWYAWRNHKRRLENG